MLGDINEPLRYTRVFARRQRAELIDECSRRLGYSVADLQAGSLEQLRSMLDHTRHELLIDEGTARSLLDPMEMPRVRDFFAGEESARSILDGSVTAPVFFDCFLIWSGDENRELIRNGRSLRNTVETIKLAGGLAAAAATVPWLASALRISEHASLLEMLQRRRIFVRHAVPHEALSASPTCVNASRPVYIEEGQHRAIAAAWVLSRGGTQEPRPEQLIAYVRGVNRRGQPAGEGFWRVHGRHPGGRVAHDARYPIAELCSGAVSVLLAWMVGARLCRGRTAHERGRRARPRQRGSPAVLGGKISSAPSRSTRSGACACSLAIRGHADAALPREPKKKHRRSRCGRDT